MTTREEHNRLPDRFRPGYASIRRGAFYVSVIGALALYGVMMGEMLLFVVFGWMEVPGIHHVHDFALFGVIWLGIIGLAAQLYRPDDRVNAVLVSALVMVPLAVIAVSTGSPIAMMPILFGIIGLVVVALHPAGRTLLAVRREGAVDKFLLGLLAVAAVPLLVFAADQLLAQYTVADEHAVFVHYGAMAVVAGMILIMGGLAIVRTRDRRFAAWSAGLLAAYVGLVSVLYPDQPSSVGVLWGALAILWGGAFLVAFEMRHG